MRTKKANTRLAAAMDQAGLSKAALARLVTDLAGARGLGERTFTTTQVTRWCDGQQPRAGTAHLIADLFTERLGCRTTPRGLGFTVATAAEMRFDPPTQPATHSPNARSPAARQPGG